MDTKKSKKPSSKITTVSKEPTPKHSPKEKAAIAASQKLSKSDYEKSQFHNVMPYEAAKSFTPNPVSTEKPKISGTAKLKVTTGIAKQQQGGDELFIKDIVEVTSVNEFNSVFNMHYNGKQIKHRGTGVIIKPTGIYPSKLDVTQNSLRYELNDTTGGVQLKKFFQFLEIVD